MTFFCWFFLFFSIVTLNGISSTTGIILDTTFTFKAVKGMLTEMEKNPNRFKGRRVLFIHTGMLLVLTKIVSLLFLLALVGGLFGVMNGALDETVIKEGKDIIKLSDVLLA